MPLGHLIALISNAHLGFKGPDTVGEVPRAYQLSADEHCFRKTRSRDKPGHRVAVSTSKAL